MKPPIENNLIATQALMRHNNITCTVFVISFWAIGLALYATSAFAANIGTQSHTEVTTIAEKNIAENLLANPSYNANIAFAGGGWRAHTGHAAWVMSLLKKHDHSLVAAFANVGAISSNSGGSWFNTMLTYSPSFVNAIEADNAIQQWSVSRKNATGWLGQQEYLFNQAPCHEAHGDLFSLCVAAYYTGSPIKATYWHNIVNDVVFRSNQVKGPLKGQRQPWAKDKALILAATMLTSNAVLNESKFDAQYYQACQAPSKPNLMGKKGASCSDLTVSVDVTPVAFSSLPEHSSLAALPFFSALSNNTTAKFNIGYSEGALFWPTKIQTSVSSPTATDTVPIIVAASASSAAAGFAASRTVTGSWAESYLASDEPISFVLEGGLKHTQLDNMSTKQLAANQAIQIADGGAADNSAVAHLVSFLQQNNQADGFNIVAFDNVQETFLPNNNSNYRVGIDFANLFGEGLWKGNQICSGQNGTGHCVTTPKLQVFEKKALNNTPVTWSAQAKTHNPPKRLNEILYTRYQVTTTDNPNFGIKAGSQGTLHAFTAAWSNADTAPKNNTKDSDFKAYQDMLNFIDSGLNTPNQHGHTGINYLQKALGHNLN